MMRVMWRSANSPPLAGDGPRSGCAVVVRHGVGLALRPRLESLRCGTRDSRLAAAPSPSASSPPASVALSSARPADKWGKMSGGQKSELFRLR